MVNLDMNLDLKKVFGEELGGRISQDAYKVLDYAVSSITKDLPTTNVTMEYVILALLGLKNSTAYAAMNEVSSEAGLDIIYSRYFQVINTTSISAIKPTRQVKISDDIVELIRISDNVRKNLNDDTIMSVHILLALLGEDSPEEKFRKAMNKVGIDYQNISENWVIEKFGEKKEDTEKKPLAVAEFMSPITGKSFKVFSPSVQKKNGTPDYCININEKVREGKINRIIGRDTEFKEIIRTLGRRKKNNVILVGGEGVGKTAMCEGLAYLIENKEVPDILDKKEVISLDMTSLIAGTTLRGMFEERVHNLLETLTRSKKYILFIDNIDSILSDKGKNDYDISSMLSDVLESGEVQIIGTATYKGFRKTFDSNPSLSRKFQKMQIEAPNAKDTEKILASIKGGYEDYHNVTYTDDAIEACVLLAEKYVTDRNLPDSAIDIMDEAGSDLNSEYKPSTELSEIRNEINEIRANLKYARTNDDVRVVEELSNKNRELVSKMIKITEDNKKERQNKRPTVNRERIYDIVSEKTGIPLSKLNASDMQRLADMEERIKSEVIGQDDAVNIVTRALKRNRVGLKNGRTMGSFLLLGPTGTGKTLLAKKIAQEIFGDEKSLVRFDMSEYMDKTSVNKLIGANPGYVGYEEGGLMTEAIKNKKHCVLLLDEIEKADQEVYNTFLQVFDEGFLTDNSGQKIDFKNVIIILTSNVGVKTAFEFGNGIGFNENVNENRKKILSKELKKKFPPEFINRLDNIVYFNSLGEEELKKIISIEMKKVSNKIIMMGSILEYNDDIIDYIYSKIKDEKEYGARPIIRAIQDEIEDRITDTIIEKNYTSCHTFSIMVDKGEIHIY